MYNYNLEQDILEALRQDPELQFKETTKYFEQGRCPQCNRKSIFISKDRPGRLICNHRETCNKGDYYTETTRERYGHLFENISERFPATPKDQNASAKAYMSTLRGFPLDKVGNWFTQGSLPLKNGKIAATVRFMLWDGFYWERLIDVDDVRTYGDKNHNKSGLSYKNKAWTPPDFELKKDDKCFITEGIFHSMALTLIGKKSIAAFSSNNFPRELIKANAKKNITWCLAYDNDANGAGTDAAIKYRKELEQLGEKFEVYQCPLGSDWDDIYNRKRKDDAEKTQLNDEFLKACLHRGRVNTALTIEEKAYWLFTQYQYYKRVVEFENRYFSCSSKPYLDLIKREEGMHESASITEIWTQQRQQDLFSSQVKRDFIRSVHCVPISNCYPRFTYAEEDRLTEHPTYNFQVRYHNGMQTKNIELLGKEIATASAFKQALVGRASGADFKGEDGEFQTLKDEWFGKRFISVDTVPFAGYDKESGIYIFKDFAFYEGRRLKMNPAGFFTGGKTNIKTQLKSFKIETSRTFNGDWINDFYTAFHENGLITLAFFTGSLFAEQIRDEESFFPFLELTGDPGTGKTTLIKFCQKLMGRTKEGFNPSKANPAAIYRALAQVANLPVVLIEGDMRDEKGNKKGFFDFNELKDLFGGEGMKARGVANSGYDIELETFKASVMISQNEAVDAEVPVLERTVYRHSTKAHHDPSKDTRSIAERFSRMEMKECCGYMGHVLTKGQSIQHKILSEYKRIDALYSENPALTNQRIRSCHALIAACCQALHILFPKLEKGRGQQLIQSLEASAEERHRRVSKDHPTVELFWEAFESLNLRDIKTQEQTLSDLPGDEVETLNHSKDTNVIAIKLMDVKAEAEKAHYERFDIKELKKLLPNGKTYEFLGKGTTNSQITHKSVHCWRFKKPK